MSVAAGLRRTSMARVASRGAAVRAGGSCYYHYAASFRAPEHANLGVGNLLVVEAAKMAKRMGYRRLHLGGGPTTDPNDSVLAFKAAFTKPEWKAWTYIAERYAVVAAKEQAVCASD